MAGERGMDSGAAHCRHGILVPADRLAELAPRADRQREQGVVGDQDAGLFRRHGAETLLDQPHLGVVDPPVPERQRPGGVDPEHGNLLVLEPGAEIVRDIGLVPMQRRGEAADDIVEGNVVIAGDGQHLVARPRAAD